MPALTMFLRSPMEQSFSMRATTSPWAGWQVSTVKTKLPSAQRMDWPGVTELASEG